MRRYIQIFGFIGVFVMAGLIPLTVITVEELAPRFMRPDVYARFVGGYGDDLIVGTIVVLFVVYLFAFIIFTFAGPALSFFGVGTKKILKYGRPAAATIKRIGESSQGGVITVNDQPFLNLILEINDGVRTPYEVSLDTIIPRYAVPQFQPGAVIAVKVDPNDPEKVAITWQ